MKGEENTMEEDEDLSGDEKKHKFLLQLFEIFDD